MQVVKTKACWTERGMTSDAGYTPLHVIDKAATKVLVFKILTCFLKCRHAIRVLRHGIPRTHSLVSIPGQLQWCKALVCFSNSQIHSTLHTFSLHTHQYYRYCHITTYDELHTSFLCSYHRRDSSTHFQDVLRKTCLLERIKGSCWTQQSVIV